MRDRRSQPAGQVSLAGDLLELEFRYSPERVAAIKLIPQARFKKENKSWTVPLRFYPQLEQSTYFGPDQLRYNFNPELIQKNVGEAEELMVEAEAAWRSNPFSVPSKYLQWLDVDVRFGMDDRNSGLRAVPRFGSKAAQLVEKTKGAEYLRAEKSFFFPTTEISLLLRQLRDRQLTFAVDEKAGARLSASAETRARLLESPDSGDAEELREALLVPFLDMTITDEGEDRFFLFGYTTQQLKACFPDIKAITERRALAAGFTEDQLWRLQNRLSKLSFRVWQTKLVSKFLARRKERLSEQYRGEQELPDEIVAAVDCPICWTSGYRGGLGLLISDEYEKASLRKNKRHPLGRLVREKLAGVESKFYIGVGDSKVLALREALQSFSKEKSLALPKESHQFQESIKELERRVNRLRMMRSLKAEKDAVLDPSKFSSPEMVGKLFPHQRIAVSWLSENTQAFLGDDMGLGKTLSVLAAFDTLKMRGEVDFLFVVCPNSLVRNWIREAEHWFPKLKLIRLPADREEKVHNLKALGWGGIAADGLIVNYEGVRLDYVAEGLGKLLSKQKAMLCLDESQRVKNATSKIFGSLSQLAPLCPRKVLLSGTPTPKDVSDIWAQIFLLDGGERFGTNFYEWLAKVAELGNRFSEFAVKRFRKEEVDECISRVHELLLRRKKEEVVQLPEKTFIVRDIELSGDQLKRYDEIRKDLLLRVSSVNGNTYIREINNVLEEYLRAVQAASNPRLIDPLWKGEPAKFLELDGILEELVSERDEKLVIWTNYLGNVAELNARYKKYGCAAFSGEVSTAERDRILQEFQNGKDLKVLVAVPAAGGVGITLTAAQTAIYVDKTWNAEHWLQSIDRIHRIGQKGTVRIISLQASRVDELIANNLARKGREQAELLGDKPRTEMRGELYPSKEELLKAVR